MAPSGQGWMVMSATDGRCARAVRRGVTVFLLAVSGFCTVPAGAAPPVCEIVIGSCHRPPLSNAAGTGIVDRLAIEAFRRIGLAACIEAMTCERSLRNADSGMTDGDLLRVPDAIASGSPNLVAVPEALYTPLMNAFTSDPALRVDGLDDLAPLRVGHILGWKVLEERLHAAAILRVRGPEELFPLLSSNKVDLVIYERLTGLQLIKDKALHDIRVIDPPLLAFPQHLVLNRRHQHLAAPLAAAIRALKADGTYAAAFRAAGYSVPEGK